MPYRNWANNQHDALYMQTGWWCSLSDPLDMEGQLVDEDNLIAEQARRTARAQLASSTADAAISEMASDAHAGGIMDDATYAQITTRRRDRGAAIDPETKPK